MPDAADGTLNVSHVRLLQRDEAAGTHQAHGLPQQCLRIAGVLATKRMWTRSKVAAGRPDE